MSVHENPNKEDNDLKKEIKEVNQIQNQRLLLETLLKRESQTKEVKNK
jgi:hypothetical protein